MYQVTEWYQSWQKPVRVGVYQRERNSVIIYSYWDGGYWHRGGDSVESAYHNKGAEARVQVAPWRGILK